jgi:hypothetical protein
MQIQGVLIDLGLTSLVCNLLTYLMQFRDPHNECNALVINDDACCIETQYSILQDRSTVPHHIINSSFIVRIYARVISVPA